MGVSSPFPAIMMFVQGTPQPDIDLRGGAIITAVMPANQGRLAVGAAVGANVINAKLLNKSNAYRRSISPAPGAHRWSKCRKGGGGRRGTAELMLGNRGMKP